MSELAHAIFDLIAMLMLACAGLYLAWGLLRVWRALEEITASFLDNPRTRHGRQGRGSGAASLGKSGSGQVRHDQVGRG